MSFELGMLIVGIVGLLWVLQRNWKRRNNTLSVQFQAWSGYTPILLSLGFLLFCFVFLRTDGNNTTEESWEGFAIYLMAVLILAMGIIWSMIQNMINAWLIFKHRKELEGKTSRLSIFYLVLVLIWLVAALLRPAEFVLLLFREYLGVTLGGVLVFYAVLALVSYVLRQELTRGNRIDKPSI